MYGVPMPCYERAHMDERRFYGPDCIKVEDDMIYGKLPYDHWDDWLYCGGSVIEAVAYLIKMDRQRFKKYWRTSYGDVYDKTNNDYRWDYT